MKNKTIQQLLTILILSITVIMFIYEFFISKEHSKIAYMSLIILTIVSISSIRFDLKRNIWKKDEDTQEI